MERANILIDRDEDPAVPILPVLQVLRRVPGEDPLPDMLVDLRADYEAKAARRGPRRRAWRAWASLWSSCAGFRVTSVALRLGSRLPRSVVRRRPGPGAAWAAGRELPPIGHAGSFRAWLGSRRDGP